ncbi:MAG: hypothetical protein IJ942_06670 [Alistipes sp.]|nr:hypothetical protein [Alistipes sp.]MBR2116685.1 hypothetical protein [Alistipes sp.]MBR3590589.1 hypothetical protein [Alistipes sp.]
MKNFVKHILAIAICAAALLSSCIKEQEFIRSTTELSVSLTGIEDTRSATQGNLIKDAWIWAYQCTVNETRNTITVNNQVPVGSRYVYGLNSYNNISVHLPLPACSEQNGTPVPQSYLLVAVINTEAFGNLNLSANSTWDTVKNATFVQPDTFWDSYPKNDAPEVMPISNWTTLKIQADDTHSDNCYNLNLPVYRAVAKTQLYMSKAGDFDLQVLNAEVVANTEYSQGMLLTGNKNSSVLDANGNPTSEVLRGDNNEKVYQGLPSEAANPWWWDASPAVKSADKGYQLKNSESGFTPATIETTGSATNPESGTFTWVASTFLLENDNEAAYGVGAYDAPQGDGYNLRVRYKVGEGEPVEVYTPLGKVVRNHDYKVYATVNAGGEMIFNIVVNEWLVEEQVLNYQDIATVTTDGHIKWSNLPSVAGQNQINASGQVESGVINLTAAGGRTATFSFTLATPVTGRWIAELRTVKGDAGDIVFADGSTVMEGDIDNIANEITIKNLSDNLAQSGGVENRVTLHIYAKAYWGDVLRSYRVDGIVGAGMTFTDYTIVQPTQ